MQLQPKKISDLMEDIGYYRYFRIRHCTTLEDYCVTRITQRDKEHRPLWFSAIKLDEQCKPTELRGDGRYYVLLSTKHEASILEKYQIEYLKMYLKDSYRTWQIPMMPP